MSIHNPNPFGWEYPPGCSAKDIDDAFGEPPDEGEPPAREYEYEYEDRLEPRWDRPYVESI